MIDMLKDTICVKSKETTLLPEEVVPAMAYIPFQQWDTPYDSVSGFNKGTIFPVLDKPFTGRGGEYK